MKPIKSTSALGWPAALLVALGGFVPLPGLAGDSEVGTYRCAVTGDTNYCHAAEQRPAVRIESQLVPGPYARYLMYRGETVRRAVMIAGGLGESPVQRTVRVTTRNLTSFEKYQRWRGGSSEADLAYETLAEQPVDPALVK